ncbi:ABC transporter ATP-binding protein [Collinsella intestinalis]|uniref:ABC transporter ATP-binding protein n=1 Tax=Collinsella intestinalis TaxID=147207 RepID=UPI0022E092F1|nr:ATP-binding cassette domain-containing protein [Collinsella intestinalis]
MYDPRARFWHPRRAYHDVLRDLTLSVHEGEILALVGASGSGKSVLADALMGLFDANAVSSGEMWFDGSRVAPGDLGSLRGHGISLVPQGVSSLDPLMRVGEQVRGEARGADRRARREDARRRMVRQRELFEAYGLASEVERMYPHELSGGMARRVLLMCALMEEPRLLIADEPTPGMDDESAAVAAHDLRAFAQDGGGVLLITHDLDFALSIADRLAVFREGTVVEETSVSAFRRAEALRDPYARELSRAWIRLHEDNNWASGALGDAYGKQDGDGSVLVARDLAFARRNGDAVFAGADVNLAPGARLALRGASGAGKTTLCRVLAGQLMPNAGVVLVDGEPIGDGWGQRAGRRFRAERPFRADRPFKEGRSNRTGRACPVQLVSQHPEEAFDPALSLRASLAEAGDVDGPRAGHLMRIFSVEGEWLSRRPHEVSGGQLMRVALVRALMASPRVLICDESTASLDLLSQEEIWRAVVDCQESEGFGLIVVSHDSSLVERLATEEAWLENGHLVRNSSTN